MKVKLKSLDELKALGFVYNYLPSSGVFILTNGKEVFKSFDKDCFESTYIVEDKNKIIQKAVLESLVDLFNVVEE